MKQITEILYCSTLCSERMLSYIFNTSTKKPLFSIQKFHRLIVEGFIANDVNITALSSIPIIHTNHSKIWWNPKVEKHDNVSFIYLPFINLPIIRYAFIFFFSFYNTLIWCLNNKRKKSIIVFDVLKTSISLPSLIVAKIFKFKTVGIVTDIPLMVQQIRSENRKTIIEKLAPKINSKILNYYDGYILLTEYMTEFIKTHHKPFIRMEGLVDFKLSNNYANLNKAKERILLYAGGIYEKYGIKKLIEAFMLLKENNLKLHIYGSGEMEDEMNYYINKDNRIAYYGVVSNQEIVDKLEEATLLINPRSSQEEFTKYSFPSKNMEYMVSGTPLATTPLPGMPKEYYKYVYIIDDETTFGLYSMLEKIFSYSDTELKNFGLRAKQFVLDNKNNYIQTKRILNLFDEVVG